MSGSDRGDRGALVALAIVVIAVLIIWTGEPFKQIIRQPASDYITASQIGDVAQSVSSSNNFNPWLDSYAQWGMAVLSLLATGVSILAVLLLRKTLSETQATTKATKEGNIIARDTGQAQVRAYLTCASGKFRISKTHVVLFITLKNHGSSPCLYAKISTSFFYDVAVPDTEGPILVRERKKMGTKESICESIASGSDETTLLPIFYAQEVSENDYRHIYGAGGGFDLECRITWIDVFHSSHTITVYIARGDITGSESFATHTANTGPLIIQNHRYEIKTDDTR